MRVALVVVGLLLLLSSPVRSEPIPLPIADDAGSGRDAPDDLTEDLFLANGSVHQGNVTVLDLDHYAISLRSGDRLAFRIGTTHGAFTLYDPSGTRRAVGIIDSPAHDAENAYVVDIEGKWHLRYDWPYPHTYFLSLGVNGPAPAPLPFSASALSGEEARERPSDAGGPGGAHAVVGVIDSGFDIYHASLRDESALGHTYPGEYLPGYPAGIEAIHLTFDHATKADAVRADCAEWAKVEPGRMYWFPGTKVVGAITLAAAPITCDDPTPRGIVGNEHGTLTTARAVGDDIGGCPKCRLVFAAAPGPLRPHASEWVAAQPFVDAQSNTWTPFPLVYSPIGASVPVALPIYGEPEFYETPDTVERVRAAAARQLLFFSTMNGFQNAATGLGHPSFLVPHLGPDVIRVGAHDNGGLAAWSGFPPHVVADGCDNWAPIDGAIEGEAPVGYGTSSSTPFATGLAARILLEARAAVGDTGVGERDGALVVGTPTQDGPLADGRLTRAELLDAYFHTAERPSARAEDGARCSPGTQGTMPLDHPDGEARAADVALVGYGAVSKPAAAAALRVVLGLEPEPERSVEDAFFEADATRRDVTHEVWTLP